MICCYDLFMAWFCCYDFDMGTVMILDVGQTCDLKANPSEPYPKYSKIVSKQYQNRIKTVSKSYQKRIKIVSKSYQNHAKTIKTIENSTKNMSLGCVCFFF